MAMAVSESEFAGRNGSVAKTPGNNTGKGTSVTPQLSSNGFLSAAKINWYFIDLSRNESRNRPDSEGSKTGNGSCESARNGAIYRCGTVCPTCGTKPRSMIHLSYVEEPKTSRSSSPGSGHYRRPRLDTQLSTMSKVPNGSSVALSSLLLKPQGFSRQSPTLKDGFDSSCNSR